MQKRISPIRGLLWACALWLPAGVAAQPSLNQLLDRHAEAMGGEAAWAAVRSHRIVHTHAGGRITELVQRPDRCQLVFESPEGTLQVKSYDGSKGWLLRDGKVLPMDAGEAIEMAEEAEFQDELLQARARGHKLKSVGKQTLDGKAVHVIELRKSEQDVQTYYLDAQTYLLAAVGEYSQDPKWKGTYFKTIFQDYAAFGGLQFPRRFGLQIGEQEPRWYALESVELNPPLVPAQFSMPPVDGYADVQSLVAAMHAAAARSNLRAYTFVQQTVRYGKEGEALPPETWYESVQFPDLFRIDVGDPKAGRGVIYRNDSTYYLREGKVARAVAEPMPFLLLEGGLKCHDLETVLHKMEEQGYDLGRLHRDTMAGRDVYVIGADAGDLGSKQVWVDAERLIPLRHIDPERDGTLIDVVFGKFERHAGKWIETEVEIMINGKLFQTERYTDIEVREGFDPRLFQPARAGEWHWKQ